MLNRARVLFVVLVVTGLRSGSLGQTPPESEATRTSKLTGTSLGAMPERDLRPSVNSSISAYLGEVASDAYPPEKVSNVEVLFWRGAVTPEAVEAYEKLVTDNLAQGGFTYKIVITRTADGQSTTQFDAHSDKKGRIIGYWQTTSAGLLLNWAQASETGATTAPPAPTATAPPAAAQSAAAAPATPTANDKNAQIAELKRRLAELDGTKTSTAGASAAVPAATAQPSVVQASTPQAANNVPLLPIEQSPLVIKDASGALVVADKSGKGIDGFKLSKHDKRIGNPSIAVGPDRTIHVAFLETHSVTGANAIYYRSSADGGATWTEAKNLSEEMPGIDVGRSQVLVDSHNRVYVIWRAALNENWTGMVTTDPAACRSNLVFRELEGGQWSKIEPIGGQCTQATQQDSSRSFFAVVDAAGRAQVIWNVLPDKWHPEVMTGSHRDTHSNGVGNGLVFQSALDGKTAGEPREVFLPTVTPPANAWGSPSCDDLDTLNGYVDAAGAAHFVALVTMPMYGLPQHPPHYEVIENAKAAQGIDLPDLSFHAARDIPTLLIDAKGRQHLIALFLAGEHPNVRDYLVGSDNEPAVIRAAVGLSGKVSGFQAFQGPGGRMIAIMQFDDVGDGTSGDNFISISTGDGKWSAPVNVTNNAGRKTGVINQTTAVSEVTRRTGCQPGPGAAAIDQDGHLLLAIIQNEYAIVDSGVVGINIAGGGVTTPTLRFMKF